MTETKRQYEHSGSPDCSSLLQRGDRVRMNQVGEEVLCNGWSGWFRRALHPERSKTGTIVYAGNAPNRAWQAVGVAFDSQPGLAEHCAAHLFDRI
jgi:hypothetical protein